MGLFDKVVLATLPAVPRPIMRRLAARYIAGETLEEALDRLADEAGRGFPGVLDLLGEDVDDERAARQVLAEYRRAVDALAERGLDTYVSVKPTHFGLRLSSELAAELYDDLLTHCARHGQRARVEMEDHTTTDATLAIYSELRARHDNVGIVLQSRLFRTPDDVSALAGRVHDVRLVKGVYLEPPEIAHTDASAIRTAFVELAEALWRGGHTVALATHDEHLAARCLRTARDLGVADERIYFEVLLGVQEHLWERWRAAGHLVRVYVPYGPEWRAYSTRRLQKNPEILRHVVRQTFRRRRR